MCRTALRSPSPSPLERGGMARGVAVQRRVLASIHIYTRNLILVTLMLVNFLFFGHNSLPYHALLTKIGGMKAISLPDLAITSKSTKKIKRTIKTRDEI